METKIFERKISKGLMAVSLSPAGKLVLTQDGRIVDADAVLEELSVPAQIAGSTYTHAIAGRYAVAASEAAAINAVLSIFEGSPRGVRNKLARALSLTDGEAFPGTPAWHRYNEAGKALQAFDDEHPEVLEQIWQERSAALRGVDVLGL